MVNAQPRHYLDHNATSPAAPEVVEAMLPFLGEGAANPSSLHLPGRLARAAIDRAREQVAQLAGVSPRRVIFTSGGTEANTLALRGALSGLSGGRGVAGSRLAVGATEHPSVQRAASALAKEGVEVTTLAVDRGGRLELDTLAQWLAGGSGLVSVMWANNESGVIEPARALAERIRDTAAIHHCDAVQVAGRLPLSGGGPRPHLISLSAHKIAGPQGIGALICDPAVELAPIQTGGGQESGLRGGTEAVAAIAGFGRAAELVSADLEQRSSRLLALRSRLEAGIDAIPGAVLFAAACERLPNTSLFALPGIDGATLVMQLDRLGFAISSGSACASGATAPSPVLTAMGVESALARRAVRVSLGPANSEEEIDLLLAALRQLAGLPSAVEPSRLSGRINEEITL